MKNTGHQIHPTKWIKNQRSESLAGKTIVLGVTGSIAAVRVVEMSRDLIRNGADVYAVTTEASEWIINPFALNYATGNNVITELTGDVEHVKFCGLNGCADLLVIVPATANTIGKIAGGIDDTPVTTFATTALGSNIPIMIVPAMHESMYNHPGVVENIDKLKSWGVSFVGPYFEEGVAKVAPNDTVELNVERAAGDGDLTGIKILITGGATAESIDPIRILTNRSSGKTGIELALEAYRRGAYVTIVHRNHLDVQGINEKYVESADQMIDAVMDELDNGYDAFISSAAISDYTLDYSSHKIKSGNDQLSLVLKPTRKLLNEVRKAYPKLVITGFKAETGIKVDELISRSQKLQQEHGVDLMVANNVGYKGMGDDTNEVYIIDSDSGKPVHVSGSKRVIASKVFDNLAEKLKRGIF
ncbi:bifunctional phosphopantothenoylcysteine decarboxylase/phosphopantothenate--cysteine ligase CoaBC [Methanohalobium sp.]|uniref:bifunctional phosphopantothenoylcysteine decarboxylase/phosphopantothenate--cysteine ligase CoaBC n=1 Tax=Methanohalobium sp. TaxID=2837493 RepID=UPI0025F31DCF|nr:bifunctional phosphopantothenoylcysteine decarboxylase/phosphopantothenate--cysteine ligase CoaBC [Methanohalobium sp.]